MHIGKKKITISAFIVVVFVSVIVWAATSYPNAAISFSGIKMVANGSTTQGFVDISLKNIDSTAISYCIEYDKNRGLQRWNFPFQSLSIAKLYLRSADYTMKKSCGIYEIKNNKETSYGRCFYGSCGGGKYA